MPNQEPLREYVNWAKDVSGAQTGEVDVEKLSYLALGLSSEAGEVADHLKRLIRDGVTSWKPGEVADELGDVIYYWAALCASLGHNPNQILDQSRNKIDQKIDEKF